MFIIIAYFVGGFALPSAFLLSKAGIAILPFWVGWLGIIIALPRFGLDLDLVRGGRFNTKLDCIGDRADGYVQRLCVSDRDGREDADWRIQRLRRISEADLEIDTVDLLIIDLQLYTRVHGWIKDLPHFIFFELFHQR
jgi:hypothetical protein